MAFLDMLDHKCDIYHLVKSEKFMGYGLQMSEESSYPENPDEKNVICHFGVESLAAEMRQEKPMNVLTERVKLTLPIDTDIRINDKVVDCESGFAYTAERPHNVRGHHIFVYLKRTKVQEAV